MKTVKAKLPKFIKSITVLHADSGQSENSEGERVVVKAKRKRKKQSKGLIRIWERIVRQTAKSAAKTAETYEDRHERSNRKRRDGWLRDYSYNMLRAGWRGRRAFKLFKIFR